MQSAGPEPEKPGRLTTIIWHMLKKKQRYRYESLIKRHRDNKVVRRKGVIRVICSRNPRHKQRQG